MLYLPWSVRGDGRDAGSPMAVSGTGYLTAKRTHESVGHRRLSLFTLSFLHGPHAAGKTESASAARTSVPLVGHGRALMGAAGGARLRVT